MKHWDKVENTLRASPSTWLMVTWFGKRSEIIDELGFTLITKTYRGKSYLISYKSPGENSNAK